MLPQWIQRRVADVQKGWTEAERARRARLTERRMAELIELMSGTPAQVNASMGSGNNSRTRADVHVAS